MKTIQLLVDFTYDEEVHGTDEESINFLYDEVLCDTDKQGLILHSNMIGDELGTIRVLEIIE